MDWIASFATLIGMLLVGRKIAHGWIFSAVGATLFLLVAIQTGLQGMAVLDLCLIFLSIINWIDWVFIKKI